MHPVHECWSDVEADVVVSCLGAHGIVARANSEVPHSVLPITIDGLGKVQVLVSVEDVEQAQYILRERAQFGEGDAEEEERT